MTSALRNTVKGYYEKNKGVNSKHKITNKTQFKQFRRSVQKSLFVPDVCIISH